MKIVAPAKINLALYLGPVRNDGLHELVSVFEPVSLVDTVEVQRSADRDRVRFISGTTCGDLRIDPMQNTVARTLAAIREAGWDGPPVSVTVTKEIPTGAGLGGGSADAAALIRLLWSDADPKALAEVAMQVGADVPSQLDPRLAMVGGAGERVVPLSVPPAHGILLMPGESGLSTADVFAEADRLGLGRSQSALESIRDRLVEELDGAMAGRQPLPDCAAKYSNDLEQAAIRLDPTIALRLAALRDTDPINALMTGSGSTVFAIYPSVQDAYDAAQLVEAEKKIVCTGGLAPSGIASGDRSGT